MSLFLVYFEIGKPVAPSPLPAKLAQMPLLVRIKGRSGPARPGMAITDGVSSERFLRFGKKVADREGEILRQSLCAFLGERLEAGAHPHLVFEVFTGLVESVTVDLTGKTEVALVDLPSRFARLKPSDVIEIVREAPERTAFS